MSDHGGIYSEQFIQVTQSRADDNHEQPVHHDGPIERIEIPVQKNKKHRGRPDTDVRLNGTPE